VLKLNLLLFADTLCLILKHSSTKLFLQINIKKSGMTECLFLNDFPALRVLFFFKQLFFVQVKIGALKLHQVFMVAMLNNLTIVHHQYFIGIFYG
jgi:hypothetical protein